MSRGTCNTCGCRVEPMQDYCPLCWLRLLESHPSNAAIQQAIAAAVATARAEERRIANTAAMERLEEELETLRAMRREMRSRVEEERVECEELVWEAYRAGSIDSEGRDLLVAKIRARTEAAAPAGDGG